MKSLLWMPAWKPEPGDVVRVTSKAYLNAEGTLRRYAPGVGWEVDLGYHFDPCFSIEQLQFVRRGRAPEKETR